jgi:hypothetical protein
MDLVHAVDLGLDERAAELARDVGDRDRAVQQQRSGDAGRKGHAAADADRPRAGESDQSLQPMGL